MEGGETERIVRQCYAAWAARDLERTLEAFADDCVYDLHVPQEVVSFGGRHYGKEAIRHCLSGILDQFSFLAYAVDWLVADGDTARAQIVYYYSHVQSGQQIDGRFRHVWRVTSGRVVSIDEYHDVERLRAFVTMATGLGKA